MGTNRNPDEPLTTLLFRLTPHTGDRVLVINGDRLAGIVTARAITRLIDVHTLPVPTACRETPRSRDSPTRPVFRILLCPWTFRTPCGGSSLTAVVTSARKSGGANCGRRTDR
jgi:hypothetical protein